MLKGEAVWNMTVMFMHMWSVVQWFERHPMEHELHMPHRYHPEAFEEDGFVQPLQRYSSGWRSAW